MRVRGGLGAGALLVVVTLVAPAAGAANGAPVLAGCQVFPSDNPWNEDVSGLPVRSDSAALIASISAFGHTNLHPDFGHRKNNGIPFNVVPATQPAVPINYTEYGEESDSGPFPVPTKKVLVEGGSDKHVLTLQQGTCKLYELFGARKHSKSWNAQSGAMWDLSSNALRPPGWTSADAAGLPILPGLVRYDEVASGHIDHALRFTVDRSQRGYILPARHFASSSTDPTLPPMGLRVRLKADFDLSPYHGAVLVILEALKTYGMLVADNGGSWFISGAPDKRWNDDELHAITTVPGSAFEAVDTGPVVP